MSARQTLDALDEALRAQGAWRGAPETGVADALAAPVDMAGASRWVMAVQIGGAWLAAIFLLLFLGIGTAALIKSATGWAVLGVALTGLTGFAFAQWRGPVVRQFLLVASLAGHGALLLGAATFDEARGHGFAAIAVYEAALLFAVGWQPHRLVAALMGCGAILAALIELRAEVFLHWAPAAFWLAAVLLWASERRWLAHPRAGALEALALALTLAALQGAVFGMSWWALPTSGAAMPVRLAMGAISLATLAWQARGLRGLAYGRAGRALGGAGLLGLALAATWQAPAVAMGVTLLLLVYARGRRVLAGFGAVVAVLALGRYYYDLQATLLVKAGWMVLGGVFLLAARALLGAAFRGGFSAQETGR